MLERLRFSIPIGIAINAPADLVWETLTDISSYPHTFHSVHEAASANRSSVSGHSSDYAGNASRASFNTLNSRKSGASVASQTSSHDNSQANSQANSQTNSQAGTNNATPTKLMGSKWKITRLSVLENQQYSSKVTITQCSSDDDTNNRRSFTMSTHQMLGATCSLKLIVEPIVIPSSSRKEAAANSAASSYQPASPLSSLNHDGEPPPHQSPSPSCQVTAIMTMIPYQFFVKLLGVMCCLCLLKYRARIAMECDLEDLLIACEGRKATWLLDHRHQSHRPSSHRQQQQQVEGNGISEADAASGGSCGMESVVDDRQPRNENNLGTIIEENSSGS